MNVLDLFSGIGGFSLGLERAGMRTVAFCEIDKFCQRVLRKHWPDVPCYPDVRELTAERLRADGIVVDVISGGFPCQDISVAGKGAGIEGSRSGLWREFSRIIGEVRPRYVIVENTSALLGRGLSRVLGDLAALGYDAEWHCIPASAVGAPHRRDRVWIVAYHGYGNESKWSRQAGWQTGERSTKRCEPRCHGEARSVADAARDVCSKQTESGLERQRIGESREPITMADAYRHPNAKPYSERGGGKKGEQLPNAVGGALNPTWVEWLLGFALGWTEVD